MGIYHSNHDIPTPNFGLVKQQDYRLPPIDHIKSPKERLRVLNVQRERGMLCTIQMSRAQRRAAWKDWCKKTGVRVRWVAWSAQPFKIE